jgi:hypothetical protein
MARVVAGLRSGSPKIGRLGQFDVGAHRDAVECLAAESRTRLVEYNNDLCDQRRSAPDEGGQSILGEAGRVVTGAGFDRADMKIQMAGDDPPPGKSSPSNKTEAR